MQDSSIPLTTAERQECQGWLNGTLDTWSDPGESRQHHSAPGGFTSQRGQDKLLFTHVFSKLGRSGVYADVASNHYKRISNTYFYDKCLGWRGLCAEANHIYWDETRQHRSCKLLPTCVSDTHEEVTLTLPDCKRCSWLGGMGGIGNGSLLPLVYIMNGSTIVRKKRLAELWRYYPPSSWRRTVMRCTTLSDELARLRFPHVDLLSLDVEGHEQAVLRGIDWNRTTIDYILCEDHCHAELLKRGYVATRLPSPSNRTPIAKTELLWTRPGLNPPFRKPSRPQRQPRQQFHSSSLHTRAAPPATRAMKTSASSISFGSMLGHSQPKQRTFVLSRPPSLPRTVSPKQRTFVLSRPPSLPPTVSPKPTPCASFVSCTVAWWKSW